jgi:hypothetical protein
MPACRLLDVVFTTIRPGIHVNSGSSAQPTTRFLMDSTQSGLPENKRHSPGEEQPEKARPNAPTNVQQPETTPAEERGERIATGKAIARGGKTSGDVPGATPQK